MQIAARQESEREAWRRVAVHGAIVANYGGFGTKRPIKPHELVPHAFDAGMSGSEFRERHERYMARYRERVEARG